MLSKLFLGDPREAKADTFDFPIPSRNVDKVIKRKKKKVSSVAAQLAALAFEKAACSLCVRAGGRLKDGIGSLLLKTLLTEKKKWYYLPSLEALKFWLSFNKALKCVPTLKNENMLLT